MIRTVCYGQENWVVQPAEWCYCDQNGARWSQRCYGDKNGVLWSPDRSVMVNQNGALRRTERCVMVIRKVSCDKNGVLWWSGWCVIVSRTVCCGDQDGVLQSAERCDPLFGSSLLCIITQNYTNNDWDMIIMQRRIQYFWILSHDFFFLNVLLTVHLNIFLNINQLDALNFIISLFQASTCFEHMCSSSGGQNCIIQSLVSSHL